MSALGLLVCTLSAPACMPVAGSSCQQQQAAASLQARLKLEHSSDSSGPPPPCTSPPPGTWKGGREKAPAAFCRKVLTSPTEIEMWGDGLQTRSFTFIDDCIEGVLRCAAGLTRARG